MRLPAIGRIPVAGLLAFVVAACSETHSGTATAGTGPSALSPVTASIGALAMTPDAPFVYESNVTSGQPRSAKFNLIVAALQTVTMSSATVHLGDGSNLGGPSVTFPQASLTSQFGSTVVVAGATRAFAFSPQFGPGATPHSISVNLLFVDMTGLSHSVFVSAPVR
jgi:hypothetical protein